MDLLLCENKIRPHDFYPDVAGESLSDATGSQNTSVGASPLFKSVVIFIFIYLYMYKNMCVFVCIYTYTSIYVHVCVHAP